jgi:hypothetical protein
MSRELRPKGLFSVIECVFYNKICIWACNFEAKSSKFMVLLSFYIEVATVSYCFVDR